MDIYDAVVVGGRGAVGTLIAQLLESDGQSVLTVDPAERRGGPGHLCADALAPDAALRSLLASAAVVVLAVPESVALQIPLSLFGEETLLVETLSVKTGFAARVAEDRTGPTVGINPMFAPSLGMDGRPVAAVVHREGKPVDDFLARITSWGGRVVTTDAEGHDRLAAATQALTHASVLAFGSALRALDVDPALVDAIAPPPARTALALLSRISGGEPEVYWDVQSGNPYAAAARSALADSVRELDSTVNSGSEARFAELMAEAGSSVPEGNAYRALCAELFGIVRSSST
ncbi:prephenate dehydrogenase dimerization domain-containing protein [Rhodococcoides yunnanense]|uniref:prephenate dehydrogenase dimerization domain-containing protein n=1 Tax=Rhodococcoides yunnanense TaxID=278209 RepID=UPI0009331642|nr:prephenate dehydrogenase dimerization domain-containing protein [Rhodococcus yunnanensis]